MDGDDFGAFFALRGVWFGFGFGFDFDSDFDLCVQGRTARFRGKKNNLEREREVFFPIPNGMEWNERGSQSRMYILESLVSSAAKSFSFLSRNENQLVFYPFRTPVCCSFRVWV